MFDSRIISKGLEDDVEFFSNPRKRERDLWIVKTWAEASGRDPALVSLGADPPDCTVNGQGVEAVEVLPPGRKRHDECKEDLKIAGSGQMPEPRFLPAKAGELAVVVRKGHLWIKKEINKKTKKYRQRGSHMADWALVVYANFPWAEKIGWAELKSELGKVPQGFQRIDVLYSNAGGDAVQTVFS